MSAPHLVYIGTNPNPDDREKVPVSRDDWEMVGRMRGRVAFSTITNLETGEIIPIMTTSCGLLHCRCTVKRCGKQTTQAEE